MADAGIIGERDDDIFIEEIENNQDVLEFDEIKDNSTQTGTEEENSTSQQFSQSLESLESKLNAMYMNISISSRVFPFDYSLESTRICKIEGGIRIRQLEATTITKFIDRTPYNRSAEEVSSSWKTATSKQSRNFSSQETKSTPNGLYQCSKCNFESRAQWSLKVHEQSCKESNEPSDRRFGSAIAREAAVRIQESVSVNFNTPSGKIVSLLSGESGIYQSYQYQEWQAGWALKEYSARPVGKVVVEKLV